MSARFITPLLSLFTLSFLFWGGTLLRALDGVLKHQLGTFSLILPLIALFVALFFGRAKPFYLSLLLLFWQLILLFPHTVSLPKNHLTTVLSLSLPLAFLFLGLLSERGIISKPGILRLCIAASLAVGSWMMARELTWSKELIRPLVDLPFSVPTSHLSLILILLSFVMLLIFGVFETKQSDKVLPWALLASCASFITPLVTFAPLGLGMGALLFIIALIQDAYKMAYIDTLTRIPSRRALEEYFTKLTPPFTVAMVDIDHFKSFNDTYGHDTGDDVLRMVATTLAKVEGGGKAFRYGGEEFTIVFANKNVKDAKVYLEAVRENIAQRGFAVRNPNRPKTPKAAKNRSPKPNTKTVALTVSLGAADTSFSPNPTHLIKKADTLLYKAKEAGRNCLKI